MSVTQGMVEVAIKFAKKNKPQVRDRYREGNAPREVKGVHWYTGNEIWGYVYSPELFIKSDATGRMCRLYMAVEVENECGELEMVIFHPDELARAKVKKGKVIFANKERLNIIDPLSERKQFARSFSDALWCVNIFRKDMTREELRAQVCTIIDKDTGREISMPRGEWVKIKSKYAFRGIPSFSEYYEIWAGEQG